MQFTVTINQVKVMEWGLNSQQATLFAFLHQVPTWADARHINGETFYNISKSKVVEELPMLTVRQDTVYRLMSQLAKAGVIQMASRDNKTYIRLTAKGITWNRVAGSEKSPTLNDAGSEQGSEKNPTSENSPSRVGKKSDPGSEKSPTNQGTNDPTPSHTPRASGADVAQGAGAQFGTGLDDSGQPLAGPVDAPRKFAMSLDWEPDSEVFAAACLRAGLAPGSGYERPQLAKFTAHFADQPGRRQSESTWVANFVDWIRRDSRFAAQQSAGGNRNAYTSRNAGGKRRRSAAEARRDAEQQRAEQAGGNGTRAGHVFEGEYSSNG